MAAGSGSRLGAAKALVEFDGQLLVERAVRVAIDGRCRPIRVVLGAAAGEVMARAQLDAAQVIVSPHWRLGIGASLQAGLDALTDSPAQAAVILLADQPLVTPAVIDRLRRAWCEGARAALATFGDGGRNPVLLDRSVWRDVLTQAVGDVGARAWLQSHPELVVPVDCRDVGDSADIDTQADLDRLRRSVAMARAEVTTPPEQDSGDVT